MKNSTIRLLFVLAILSAAGIIATQVYWVQRAYQLEEKEFNLNVISGLRNVANKIWRMKEMQPTTADVVEQISPDYFIVHINDPVDMKVLGHFLKQEFTRGNLLTDFDFGMYDCMHDTIPMSDHVQMSNQHNEVTGSAFTLPKLKNENYYFGVFFPDRRRFLNSQLSIWTVSSILLLLVLIFLGYIVFLVLKQKRLSEIQKDFVNNMTHEFKTPLASIQLSSEVLKNPNIIHNPQRLLNYATIINNEASQLTLHVERVLQMAHSEKGNIQLKKENFVWQDLIRDASAKFSDEHLGIKKAHIILDLPDKDVVFRGDRLHLTNVLNNLIDNAIKYCDKKPEIIVYLRENEGTITLTIKDNGIGIDKMHHKMLFRKFYRVPTGNIHNVKGFGLGLNYVAIITKAHNGIVSCNSEPGSGSEFILKFNK